MASAHKKALLEYKQKLLNELNYYYQRITEIQQKPKAVYYESDSSDSEFDLTKIIELGPSIQTLKQQQRNLKICEQATEELTSLVVLQSEVTLQVDEPEIHGAPVREPGDWYGVVAECRLDLVPFVITFMVHKSSRKFGPKHFRNVSVRLLKTPQEREASAALGDARRPADATEIIRRYSEEHRSRRTTLAKLADSCGGALTMAAVPSGGYTLKCLDKLEILWLLKYSKSRGTFHHSMKFDLDYLDENYIKEIKGAYARLQAAGADERTSLLEKIIQICIVSSGRAALGETTTDQSDHEPAEKRGHAPLQNISNKLKDSEIMAPPKSVPKETKSNAIKNKDRISTTKHGEVVNAKRVLSNTESQKPNVGRSKDKTNVMSTKKIKNKTIMKKKAAERVVKHNKKE